MSVCDDIYSQAERAAPVPYSEQQKKVCETSSGLPSLDNSAVTMAASAVFRSQYGCTGFVYLTSFSGLGAASGFLSAFYCHQTHCVSQCPAVLSSSSRIAPLFWPGFDSLSADAPPLSICSRVLDACAEFMGASWQDNVLFVPLLFFQFFFFSARALEGKFAR